MRRRQLTIAGAGVLAVGLLAAGILLWSVAMVLGDGSLEARRSAGMQRGRPLESGDALAGATHSTPSGEVETVASEFKTIDAGASHRYTVQGIVVESGTGVPVDDVAVTFVSGSVVPGWITDVTNGDGHFELSIPPASDGLLLVTKRGWFVRGSSLPDACVPCFVKSGEPREVTVELERAPVLSGYVLGPGETPVAGSVVTACVLRNEDEDRDHAVSRGTACSALTDESGRFDLSAPVLEGAVRLEARSPGMMMVYPGIRIDVAGAALTEARIDMFPAGRLVGRVTTETGVPIAGVDICAVPDVAGTAEAVAESDVSGRFHAQSGEDGSFEIDPVPAVETAILARHPAFIRSLSRGVVIVRGGTSSVRLCMRSGRSIWGRVVRADGAPLAAVTVAVSPVASGGERIGQDCVVQPGADGVFRIERLPEGWYRVSVDCGGAGTCEARDVLAGTTDLLLSIEAGLSISGRAEVDGGRSAAGAWVTAVRSDQAELGAYHGSVVGAGGEFLIGRLNPGTYSLHFSPYTPEVDMAEGRQRANICLATVSGVAAGTLDLAVRLRSGLGLSGVVGASDGAIVRSGRVTIRRVDAGESYSGTVTGQVERFQCVAEIRDGHFEVLGLEPGTVSIVVECPGFAAYRRTVAAGEVDLILDLVRSGSVTGRVRFSSGEPAQHATVKALGGDANGVPAVTLTDLDGRFLLVGVPPGEHRVVATLTLAGSRARYTGVVTGVVVREGERQEGVEVRLSDLR